MLPQGMFSVAVATVLFPRSARLAARGDLDGFRDTVALGLRQIALPARPGERRLRRARRADRAPRSTSAATFTPTRRRSSPARSPRSRSGSTFNGAMLMLNRGVLQPAGALDPDRDRARQPRAQHRARRRVSTASAPGGSRSRPRSPTSPGPRRCSSSCGAGSAGIEFGETAELVAARRPLASVALAAIVLRGLVRPRRGARTLASSASSSRSGARSSPAVAVYLVSCRLLGVRELERVAIVASRFRRG